MFSGWHGRSATDSATTSTTASALPTPTIPAGPSAGVEFPLGVRSAHEHAPSDSTLDARRQASSHMPALAHPKSASLQTSVSTHDFEPIVEARADGAAYPSDSLGRASVASSGNGSYYASDVMAGHAVRRSSTMSVGDSEGGWDLSESGHGEGQRSRPRRRRRHAPPELLVIVRPPPSKQNHPLNLQIQLVTPQPAPVQRLSGEYSRDGTASPTKANLQRRDSMSSSKSGRSEGSAAGSTMSSGSGRRVTPLYNLQFHNLLTTTVTDAGTDQKVAKFAKRGVELIGFGTIEPQELVYGVNDLAALEAQGRLGLTPGSSPSATPSHENISMASHRNDSEGAAPATKAEPPTSFEAMTSSAKGGEGGFGGKLMSKFKRLSLTSRPATPTSASAQGSAATLVPPSNPFGRLASTAKASIDGARPDMQSLGGGFSISAPGTNTSGGAEMSQLVAGAGLTDGKRTEGYVWIVRKWSRRVLEDEPEPLPPPLGPDGQNQVLSNVWNRFNLVNRLGGHERHPPPQEIQVRFEWTRDSRRAHLRRATEEARASARVSLEASSVDPLSRRGSVYSQRSAVCNGSAAGHGPAAGVASQGLHPSQAEIPRSTSRPGSLAGGRSPRRSVDTSAAGSARGDDDGEDSDPEDSETPWTCHLVLGPQTRIPIGTLSPAPHHPKLVGQLAIPFPLPDLSASGLGSDAAGLTREELKDIISVTCLHLVVRESFGGLGKKRKGDSGWRLSTAPLAAKR